MSDLTPERRAELRRRIVFRRQMGYERVAVDFAPLADLLDAADELDRIKGELGDPSRHSIMGGWLVIDTRQHNCGTGPGGHYGAHEPGCGLEQAIQLDNLPGWPGDERDRLAAAAERVRVLHVADGEGFCVACDYMTPHPCLTIRALDDRHE